MSAPIKASVVWTIKLAVSEKEEAAKIIKETARVNITDVFEFLGLCPSMFLKITW